MHEVETNEIYTRINFLFSFGRIRDTNVEQTNLTNYLISELIEIRDEALNMRVLYVCPKLYFNEVRPKNRISVVCTLRLLRFNHCQWLPCVLHRVNALSAQLH